MMVSTAGGGGGIGGACPTGPSTASNTNGAPGRGAATAATDVATDGGGGKKKDGIESVGKLCANTECGNLNAKKLCASCKRVSYCSRRCQKIHWGMGGHKKFCALMAVPLTNPGPALVSITSSSTPSSSQPTGPAAAYGSYPTTDVGDAVNP